MRRLLLFAVMMSLAGLAGCRAKPSGRCTSSKDCQDQEGVGRVCVDGMCQECGQDTDCKSGFLCEANKCAPVQCKQPADCGGGKDCQRGRCVTPVTPPVSAAPKLECDDQRPCAGGASCQAGKCVAPAVPADCFAGEAEGGGRRLQPVHFSYNGATLSAEDTAALQKDWQCLQGLKAKKLTIEGHCDERGTTEYNLHLGERRAEAVRRYLTQLGADAKQLKAISYGKEKPADPGHDESAWQKNRRAEIVVQ
ncbi:MAG TPA: OmpA family protein [Anaeromyxobacteraceae bacterium]|jgi:peptidoglycan-associated lipoprotein|nr:OmpA family protein [Anaeromyxobacteraceae bacterium]